MQKLLLFLTVFFCASYVYAEKFDVDTLKNVGAINRCINLVILGDGYTSSEQTKFVNDAQSFSDVFLKKSPFSNYKDYFNVIAVKVISPESGVKHPKKSIDNDCGTQPITNPNNYFGSTFDGGLTGGSYHRLVVVTQYSKVISTLSDNFPDYDIVLILANSSYYGGSGGTFAVATTNILSAEIAIHEIGHSFVKLADEYWAGDGYYNGENYPNVTMVSDSSSIKWKNWLGYNNVGIYKMGSSGKSSLWYKPHKNCEMEYLNRNFCSVCTEAVVEKIQSVINGGGGVVLEYAPTYANVNIDSTIEFSLSKILKPIPNTLKITWELNGKNIASNVENVVISANNINTAAVLSAIVTDTTQLMRLNNHEYLSAYYQTITWNLEPNKTGTNSINILASENNFSYNIYPNPASDIFTISIQTQHVKTVSIQITDLNGQILETIANNLIVNDKYTKTVNISALPQGIYLLLFKVNDKVYTQKIMKKHVR